MEGINGDNYVGIDSIVNGLVVDLGDGNNDTLRLQNGVNVVSVTNVERLHTNDFNGSGNPAFDDEVTLTSNVTGLEVDLFAGNNTLTLAEGVNSLGAVHNVSTLNGSAGDDSLTLTAITFASAGTTVVDLGDGADTLNLTNPFGANLVVENVETVNGTGNVDTIQLNSAATVTAGLGADMLTASSGADTFRFTSLADSPAAGGRDQINGFGAGDLLAFNNIGFASSIQFIDGNFFSGGGTTSQARLDGTLLQIDVNGDATADMEVELNNLQTTLSHASFMIL